MKEKFINQKELSKEFKLFIEKINSFNDENFKKLYDYISEFYYIVPTYEDKVWQNDNMFFAFTDEEEFKKYCRGTEISYTYLSFDEIFNILENNLELKVVINCFLLEAPELSFKYENIVSLLNLKLFHNIENGDYIVGTPSITKLLLDNIQSEILNDPYKSILSATLYNYVYLPENKDILPINNIALVLKLDNLPIRSYLEIKKTFEMVTQSNNIDIQIIFAESSLGKFLLNSCEGYKIH